jgi:DinB superfamily
MEVQSALKSQYHAALKTLRAAIENCPDVMWDDPTDGTSRFWRVAYHTLFYADFYLRQKQDDFTPWVLHREEAQFIESVPYDNFRPPRACDPFSRDDLLEYWRVCDDAIDAGVDELDLSASQCGFPWYEMPTLEHQIVNIRHIQHHAAALSSRLRRSAGVAIGWIGK